MSIWYILGIVFLFLMIIGIVSSTMQKKKTSRKISNLLLATDEKYLEFIEKRISLAILSKIDFDFDNKKIIEECLHILKPEIESLWAEINSTSASSTNIKYSSDYFGNVASITKGLIVKKAKDKKIPLKTDDERELYDAFKDAVSSDLSNRILSLKAGNIKL